jgi:hypothetical protein
VRENCAPVGVISIALASADAGAFGNVDGMSMDGGGACRLNVRCSASIRGARLAKEAPLLDRSCLLPLAGAASRRAFALASSAFNRHLSTTLI